MMINLVITDNYIKSLIESFLKQKLFLVVSEKNAFIW